MGRNRTLRDISSALNGACEDMSWAPTSYACPLASSFTLMFDEPAHMTQQMLVYTYTWNSFQMQ